MINWTENKSIGDIFLKYVSLSFLCIRTELLFYLINNSFVGASKHTSKALK